MARKTITKKTTEDRQKEIDALRDTQNAALLDLLRSDRWAAYLNAMKHLRKYSYLNQILIQVQNPDATQVAGYGAWQKLNRQVRKGEKSIAIWGAPFRPKIWVAKGTENGSKVLDEKDGQVKIEAKFTRCPILRVFDISQTDGEELPTVSTELTDGDDTTRPEQLIAALTSWLTNEGWTVQHEKMGGSTKGVTRHETKEIALNEANTKTQNVKTLIHEAAHAVLHGDDTYATMSEYGTSNIHRGAAEIQAESTAYVVAGMLGLDTSDYSTGYVAGWATAAAGSADEEKLVAVLKQSAGAVRHAVNTITDGINVEALIGEAEALLTDTAAA